ncbi:MAG: hypothetical protein JO043_08260 [Candidatus Eremiobacteraeota bacterium]|nr:hypothetical protein [Candidatus Eremiobacteraeota bacterium]
MMNGNRGLIANPGFEGQRVRGVYFFAGNWCYAPPGQPVQEFYEYAVAPNSDTYTIHPQDARHLGWSETPANREFALETMLASGANTVIMSYWGERGTDRWAHWAPMQTSTYAHDELFAAAFSRPLLIMPVIESSNATIDCGGQSVGFHFASDFPGSQDNPSPQLVKQCVDLIERYLHNPVQPDWAKSWLQIFDRNAEPRFAIHIVHVSSDQVANPIGDVLFAEGFNWVADRVLQLTGEKIGFTLDVLVKPQLLPLPVADCRGWVPLFSIHAETTTRAGAAVNALWASDSHLDVFIIDVQGVLQSIWWDRSAATGYRPEGWFPIHPEHRFPPGAPVTAVWANQDHLDLFVVDSQGVVQSIWWDRAEPAGYRPQGWFPIHSETTLPAGAPVTALWANGDHLDLFGADTSGVVRSIWWDRSEPSGYRPQGWFDIHPETRTSPGGYITAEWSSPNHLDLFMVSTDSAVSSIWWDRSEPSGYRPQGWFAIRAERRFELGAEVLALWVPGPQKKHLDLFTVGSDGVVLSIWWDAQQGGYRPEGWFPIAADTLSRGGGKLAACWIGDSELHLAMIDQNGGIRGANWKADQAGGWSTWFSVRAEFVGVQGQGVVLLSRDPNHVDIFLADQHGVVQSTFRTAVEDTYIAAASTVGPLLEQTPPVLAVQGFIPEISAVGGDDQRLQAKRDYWHAWLGTGIPVFFDVCPGYDARILWPGSSVYGNNDRWRAMLSQEWSVVFHGIVFNTWNGYTEGYAAVPTLEYQAANWEWIQALFTLAKP